MKEELIKKLQDLLQTEDVSSVQNDLNEIQSAYNEETLKERQAQETAWAEANKDAADAPAFEFNPNPLDSQFDELRDSIPTIPNITAEAEAMVEEASNAVEAAEEIQAEAAGEAIVDQALPQATTVVEQTNASVEEAAEAVTETIGDAMVEENEETPSPSEEVQVAAEAESDAAEASTEEVSPEEPTAVSDSETPKTEVSQENEAESETPQAATEEQSAESHAHEFAGEESAPEAKPEIKLDTKENIMASLEALLQVGNVASVKGDVRNLRNAFNDLSKAERNTQFEAWKEANKDTEDPEAFDFSPNALDEKFNALNDEYRKKFDAHMDQVRAVQRGHMEKKKEMVSQLSDLIQNEENIGAAFSGFNEINDKWKTVPFVPTDAGREMQEEFFRLRDAFFYNIRIYKALQENDLQINEKKKAVLIEKAKELAGIADIRELDRLVRAYQAEWMEVGPSPRETYKEQGDEFFGLCREAIGRIRAHYDERNAQLEGNVAAKVELIEKARQISVLEISNHSTWTKKTESMIALQKEWKASGPVPREKSEDLWKEFRGVCDEFFQAKQAFYDKRKAEQEGNKERKKALVERAKELQESDKWKETTDALIGLQKEWKAVGPAPQRDEQKLWQKFRASCDAFFTNKKKHFAGLDSKQEENLTLKKELIAEIQKTELTGDRQKDVPMLKEFSVRFNDIGYVPRNQVKAIYDAYNAALDEKYKKLNIDASEKAMMSYQQRVNNMRTGGNSDGQMKKERYILRDKIERLQSTVRQYQNNLEFFKGDGAAAMRKDYEKKISKAEREIGEIRDKLRMLNS